MPDDTLKSNSHNAIFSNNSLHTADIASCERKNRTNLSQLSLRNEFVTTCRSYKLLLQITPCELALILPKQSKETYVSQHENVRRNCHSLTT